MTDPECCQPCSNPDCGGHFHTDVRHENGEWSDPVRELCSECAKEAS